MRKKFMAMAVLLAVLLGTAVRADAMTKQANLDVNGGKMYLNDAEIEGEKVLDFFLGGGHDGAITEDGSLYIWGENDSGQIGDGTNKERNNPVKVLENVQTANLETYQSAAVTKDGCLYIWGWQWGVSNGKEFQNRPVKVLENVQTVETAYDLGGAVTKDGSLYMWGENYNGQIGDGTIEYRNKPVKVLEDVQTFCILGSTTGAVTKDGSLYMWGYNYNGQLGDGTIEYRNKPVKVLENVQAVSMGGYNNGAVTKDGSLYMWGWNMYGQLGDGTNEDRNQPVKVMEDVQAVHVWGDYTGAVTKDGSLYMWGYNCDGQLGDGTNEDRNQPVKVLEDVEDVQTSVYTDLDFIGAVTRDGSLYMWGNNTAGQLGIGTNENCNRPMKVLENVQAVCAGVNYSGAVTKDGSLYTWGGYDESEEFRYNTPEKVLENVQTVSSGLDYHSGALTNDGRLYIWGYTKYYPQGVSVGTFKNIPELVNFSSADQSPADQENPGEDTGTDSDQNLENQEKPGKDSPVAAKNSQKIIYHSKFIKKGKVIYGTSFSLNAKTTGAGKLAYKSSRPNVLSVNSKGKVTVKGYGSVYIRIKASGGNGYKAAVRKFKLIAVPKRGQVTKAEQENGVVRFTWKAEKTADGYEYATAYNKKFTGQSKKKTEKTGLALTKYKKGTQKMFIKVRTYKKVGKKIYYGDWSKVRSLKLKKVRKSGESSYAIAN